MLLFIDDHQEYLLGSSATKCIQRTPLSTTAHYQAALPHNRATLGSTFVSSLVELPKYCASGAASCPRFELDTLLSEIQTFGDLDHILELDLFCLKLSELVLVPAVGLWSSSKRCNRPQHWMHRDGDFAADILNAAYKRRRNRIYTH
jgi:hypothetical protein